MATQIRRPNGTTGLDTWSVAGAATKNEAVEIYYIEFEITPASGGKYTLPMPFEGRAEVHVVSSQDTT